MRQLSQVLLFMAYVLAARFGMEYASMEPGNLTVVWLPSGIAVIGLSLFGYRALPTIFLASLAVSVPSLIQTDSLALLLRSLSHSAVSVFLDTLLPAIAYMVYRRWVKDGALTNMPNFMMFVIGVALLPSMLTSWALIVNLQLGGYIDLSTATDWKNQIYNLTLANTLGIFLLVPIFESARSMQLKRIQWPDFIQFGYMMIFLSVVFYWLFFRENGYPVVLILPLTAIALTSGLFGTSIAFFVVSVSSVMLTMHGVGPFIVSMSTTSIYGLLFVMIGLGIPSFLIAISTHNSTKLNVDLETRVKARTKELADLNRNKDHLMSIIAHDLRNPIQGIIGVSDLMRQDVQTKDYSEMDTYSNMIHGSSKQVLQLLYNLLDWSASQSGLMRYNPKWMDLNVLVDENVAYYKEMADSKSIYLRTDIPNRLQACVDSKMMATILRNLTSNALKFTPIGGTVQIKVTPLDQNGFRLTVTDTGVGMSAEQQAILFRIDDNTQPNRGTSGEVGSGLGLMLCKTFIEKHNGQLSIYSELGTGSEFHLTFPPTSPSET